MSVTSTLHLAPNCLYSYYNKQKKKAIQLVGSFEELAELCQQFAFPSMLVRRVGGGVGGTPLTSIVHSAAHFIVFNLLLLFLFFIIDNSILAILAISWNVSGYLSSYTT